MDAERSQGKWFDWSEWQNKFFCYNANHLKTVFIHSEASPSPSRFFYSISAPRASENDKKSIFAVDSTRSCAITQKKVFCFRMNFAAKLKKPGRPRERPIKEGSVWLRTTNARKTFSSTPSEFQKTDEFSHRFSSIFTRHPSEWARELSTYHKQRVSSDSFYKYEASTWEQNMSIRLQ